jgi:heat shock protein HslJ
MGKMTRLLILPAVLAMAACGTPAPPPPAAALEGTQWRLSDLGGRKALDGANMRFDPNNVEARGNTGCNAFFGRYELDGGRLRFGAIAGTRRACGGDMDQQEGALLRALGDTRTWRIAGNTLILRGDAGDLARFAGLPRK